MKTARHLFQRLVDADWIDAAASSTVRGKRRRPEVASFLLRRESELERIRAALCCGTWCPEGYRLLFVRDPKPRVIARAPVQDRIVHTAVAELIEQAYEPRLLHADYACRVGRGTHRALLALLRHVRRWPYALHLDVRSYFPSIDTDVLFRELERRIDDAPFLTVVERILTSGRGLYDDPAVRRFARMDLDWPPFGRGLPIGAYTSQVFAAHVYPLCLDAFVSRQLGISAYVRYVDDLFLFHRSRSTLRMARDAIAEFLDLQLHLRLKRPRAGPMSCRSAVHALGWNIDRQGLVPLPRRLRTLAKAVDPRDPMPERRVAAVLGDWTSGLVR